MVALVLGGWHVAQGFEDSVLVEPGDPTHRLPLDLFERVPPIEPLDDLRLVQTDDRLGHRLVEAATDPSDRDPGPPASTALVVPWLNLLTSQSFRTSRTDGFNIEAC